MSSAKRKTLEVEDDAGRSIRVMHVQQYSAGWYTVTTVGIGTKVW